VAESNLARSLFSGNSGNNRKSTSPRQKSSDLPNAEHESRRDPASSGLNAEFQELQALRQEIVLLRQHYLEKELLYETKNSYIEQLVTENKELKRLKLNQAHTIALLQAQLNQSESTAQALARSLNSQLKHHWEQRQHELIASVSQMRLIDQERLANQASQIEHLQYQKKLLEHNQQDLIINLETALIELAQNSKIVQKLQSQSTKGKQRLEPQIDKHLSLQATLQQLIKNLELDYANSQKRVKSLEYEVTELQEQILKQVGQGTEHEAAIQHWKEKCIIHQNHAIQLSNALERLLDGRDSPQASGEPPSAINEANLLKVDLPPFVVRQAVKNAGQPTDQ